MRRNYHRKLSASIYHYVKNVGIIGILANPKIIGLYLKNILSVCRIVIVPFQE